MADLQNTTHPGTGNSKVKISKKIMIRFNNLPINGQQIKLFLNKTGIEAKVKIINRKTSRVWGSTCCKTKTVYLYRHSIWIFLHELAHITSPPKYINGRRDIHGKEFGKELERLYFLFKKIVLDKTKN